MALIIHTLTIDKMHDIALLHRALDVFDRSLEMEDGLLVGSPAAPAAIRPIPALRP